MMRKTVKKVFSTVLAAALAFGGLSLNPLSAKADTQDYTAFLMFTDNDWAFGNWDATLESATTTVSGDGSYSVTLNASEVGGDGETGANGAQVFCVDIVGAQEGMKADGKTFEVTDLKVTADGEEVACDTSKLVTGDIEENGNYRIEIYNVYGDTAADAPIDAASLTFKDTLTVDFTLATTDYVAEEGTEAADATEAAETASGEIDLDGTYHAYLGLQTPNWTYRDAWNSDNGIGSDHWGQFIYGNETDETYGTVTDAEIKGNGTYTVSITDFGTIFADDFAAAGQDYFNLLYISTDIPMNDTVKISDVTLKIDGKTITTYAEPVYDPDETEYLKPLIQNIWNEDVKEIPFYNAPTQSLEMTFTVSGFNYDNESAAPAEDTQAADTQVAADTQAADTQAAADTTAPAESGSNTTVVVVIVVIVVIAAVVAVVVVSKKKKGNN